MFFFVCPLLSSDTRSSSSGGLGRLLFFASEGPFNGLLFFFCLVVNGSSSWQNWSSCCQGVALEPFLSAALGCGSSSLSVAGRAAMPLTSKDLPGLLDLEPLSAEVEGTGTRLLYVDAEDRLPVGLG